MAELAYTLDGAQSSQRYRFGSRRRYHHFLTMAQGKRFDVAFRRVYRRENDMAR